MASELSLLSSDAVIEDIELRIDGIKNLQGEVQYQRLAYFAAHRYEEVAARIAVCHISDTNRLMQLKEELSFYAHWGTLANEYLDYLRALRDNQETDEQTASVDEKTKANHFLP